MITQVRPTSPKPSPVAVFTPDPVVDQLLAVDARWARDGVEPSELGQFVDCVGTDGRFDPGTSDGHGELEAACMFARLAGAATFADPRSLLIAGTDFEGLEAVVASVAARLVVAVQDAVPGLLVRSPAEHMTMTAGRLAALGVDMPCTNPETQSLIWAALVGAQIVAAAAAECGQPWEGPSVPEMRAASDDVAAATIALFCTPWQQPVAAAGFQEGELWRRPARSVGLAYVVNSGLHTTNRLVREHCVAELSQLVNAEGSVTSGTGDRRCWAGEARYVVSGLAAAGKHELADHVAATLGMSDSPAAFWDATDRLRTSAHLSLWAYESQTP